MKGHVYDIITAILQTTKFPFEGNVLWGVTTELSCGQVWPILRGVFRERPAINGETVSFLGVAHHMRTAPYQFLPKKKAPENNTILNQ
jgi:hypothetical protein